MQKKLYYNKKFASVQGNMKKTWALINELRGKSKTNIKASFVINGELVKDKREIANGFNNFFSSVARNLNAKLNSSILDSSQNVHETNSFTKYMNNRVFSSFYLSSCTDTKLKE